MPQLRPLIPQIEPQGAASDGSYPAGDAIMELLHKAGLLTGLSSQRPNDPGDAATSLLSMVPMLPMSKLLKLIQLGKVPADAIEGASTAANLGDQMLRNHTVTPSFSPKFENEFYPKVTSGMDLSGLPIEEVKRAEKLTSPVKRKPE